MVNHRYLKNIVWGVFGVLSLCLVGFVVYFGVNVVWGDEWDMLPFIESYRKSGLDLYSLFAPHNEHRIFFQRIIMLLNAQYFSFNMKINMVLSVLVLAATAAVILYDITGRISGLWLAVAAVLIPGSLFSVIQYENLLWGFQIGYVSSFFFSVVALALLQKTCDGQVSGSSFCLAVVIAEVASFSSGQGLFVWPAGFVLLLLSRKIYCRNHFAIWGTVAIVTWAGYFHGMQRGQTDILHVVKYPGDGPRFIIDVISHYLGSAPDGWILSGITLLIILMLALVSGYIHNSFVRFPFLFAVVAFSAMSLVGLMVGRVGAGPLSAYESRYTTFVALGIAAILGIAISNFHSFPTGFNKMILASLTILLLVCLPMSYLKGWQGSSEFHELQVRNCFLLKYSNMVAPEYLRQLYLPRGEVVRERSAFLRELGHAVFK